MHAPRLASRQHQLIAGAPSALPFVETTPMHSYRQRRFHVCRALLDKKNCSMAQSFLRLPIQFAGITKLHSGKL